VLPPRQCAGDDRARLAAELATRSFHRHHDPDVVNVSPAAMLFARGDAGPADLVGRYERMVADVLRCCDAERDALQDEVLAARQALLVNRDHVVGTEAEVGRVNRDVVRLTHELAETRKRVRALTRRRDDLTERVETLRARLAAVQKREARLSRRVQELDASSRGSSTARRIARRLLGRR
jgi:septal ring factor EnvC (AmiA/AmiB activator)